MDEASKLFTELNSKLAELDHKVWKYRQDMASEFEKYAEELLRDAPKEVSDTVSKSMAESMKGYKSLYPEVEAPFESCATGTNIHPNGDKPQPSATSISTSLLKPAYHEDESPRSPHEREKEFRGLFTPSYLPLLDSTSRNERRSSTVTPVSPPPGNISPQPRAMEPLHVDASTDTRSLVSSPEVSRPATPKRRNTDEVSVASDWSEGGTTRRSALRRSSSSSRHSPRRVRFDVAGEEVLPTASPQNTKLILTEEIPTTTFGGEMEEEARSEQIEDIDEAPPPKRISSSQALRALSRSPLVDDGTTWTTVTAPPDGSASVATTANGFSFDDEDENYMGNGVSQLGSSDDLGPLGGDSSSSHNGAHNGLEVKDEAEPEVASDDDEDMLDMPPLRRQAPSPKSMLSPARGVSPARVPDIANNNTPTASTRPSRAWQDLDNLGHRSSGRNSDLAFDAGEDDEMFNFDENAERRTSPIGPEDEEYDDFDTDAPVSPIANEPIGRYSTSPAREIVRPSPPKTAPATKGIVGSYKGRPFTMPIVSPDVHARAASMGDVSSFVGSVDGRSGVDESDLKSFRMSGGVGSFLGTPRSLSERMMLDDMRVADEAKRRR
ncbi:hypothetical protein BDZ45DRAFT_672537 [Acephala macrosclerotiorum]|nr:hypothetical protein BDZ45DRAFT_672537 [Acephala macrosclerotiorum]